MSDEPDKFDVLAFEVEAERLREENQRLQVELDQTQSRLSVVEASMRNTRAVVGRAKRVVKFAQLDGGRHALRSALADHDGREDWRRFLDERARVLEERIEDEKEVLGRG